MAPDKGHCTSHMFDICCSYRTSYPMENIVLWERDVSPTFVIFMGMEWLTQKKICNMEMASTSSESPVDTDRAMERKYCRMA